MQIKVNAEIREIKDEVALGMSWRQFAWSLVVLLLSVLVFPAVYSQTGSPELAAAVILPGGLLAVLIGFCKWHKMPLEKAAVYWIFTLVSPKSVVFKGKNEYQDEIDALCAEAKQLEEIRRKGNKKK